MNDKIFTEEDARIALGKLRQVKSTDRAALIERMMRLETGHFKSLQYQQTGSAGMEDGKWENLPAGSYTTIQMNDNHLAGDKKLRTFIKWNDVYDFCLYLSDYIDRHDGNYARWNAISPDRQREYRIRVNQISNKFITTF